MIEKTAKTANKDYFAGMQPGHRLFAGYRFLDIQGNESRHS